jgi:argininosuccinate lyase
MPGYTHTQPAQPTTLAHYLAGVLSFLERDAMRLQAAYATTNRSPLGAAAFTTSGFPVDRQHVAELLGFAKPVESSYDAVGASDHMTEAVGALVTMAANLSRFTTDLLFWTTQEAGAIRIGDDFVQTSSIMPQKRNPVVLEHLRAWLARLYGYTMAVLTSCHNVPYGDTQDIEDDIYQPLFGAFQTTDAVLELYTAVFESLEVNRARLLARAVEGFTTSTELADTLVREKGLAFRTAHAIVARLVEMATARGLSPDQVGVAMLDKAAQRVIGRPLALAEESLRRALDPVHFVQVRRAMGGPAPEMTAAVLANLEEALERDQSWLDGEKERLALTRATLDERVRAIAGDAGVGQE